MNNKNYKLFTDFKYLKPSNKIQFRFIFNHKDIIPGIFKEINLKER